jgi:hypothetical protein
MTSRLPDPRLPFFGYGSPCGNLSLQRHRAALHAQDPRHVPPVFIDFPDLADCRECECCGGCETHEDCLTDIHHIEYWAYRLGDAPTPQRHSSKRQ